MAAAKRVPESSAVVPGPRVLLVDDEAALLHATGRQLRLAGYDVTECDSGGRALDLLEGGEFDVVVSDIDMPGLSGIALLKVLAERRSQVPVILMTGTPSLDTAMSAVEHGAFKYLIKPVAWTELRETVERAARWRVDPPSGSQSRRGSSEPVGVSESGSPITLAGVVEGAVLGARYRVGRLLGEGGMSQVWEATQLRTGGAVALKVLHASLNARPAMRRRLLREARAASAVQHPNVVDVFDAFELGDGTPVLVMTLLKGRTFGDRLADEGKLSLADACDVLLPVVSAVGAAHAHGVIHRDLKPENIFLADEGGRTSVKVLDFGIAKLVTGEAPATVALTATGALVGTPGYMSPEQGMGEPDVDHRADVWAVGAMLYEALAGARPLSSENVGQMLKQLLTEGIPRLSARAPDLPSSVTDLVDRMLARERDQRPGDLREAYAELSRHATVAAPPFGPPAPAKIPSSGVVSRDASLGEARTEVGDTPAILNRKR
jgi:serine/threonine-protein kinase